MNKKKEKHFILLLNCDKTIFYVCVSFGKFLNRETTKKTNKKIKKKLWIF